MRVLPGRSVDALERIIIGGVALTTSALAEAEPGFEVTLQQWRVLMVLAERPEPMSVSRVAAAIGVTLPATSRQLHRLKARGLVAIAENPDDRRSLRVALTPAGETFRASVLEYRRRRLAAIVEGLRLTTAIEAALADVADALQPPAVDAPLAAAR
jgi:DNA-binding MarR family transcriptional regulator